MKAAIKKHVVWAIDQPAGFTSFTPYVVAQTYTPEEAEAIVESLKTKWSQEGFTFIIKNLEADDCNQ